MVIPEGTFLVFGSRATQLKDDHDLSSLSYKECI